MATGDYKVAYLIQNRSIYGDFIVVGRWYDENATKNFSKHFVFDRAILSNVLIFLKLCSFIK